MEWCVCVYAYVQLAGQKSLDVVVLLLSCVSHWLILCAAVAGTVELVHLTDLVGSTTCDFAL